MSEMIERIEGVIARHYYGDSVGTLDAMSSHARRQFRELAVKMFAATREPTESMIVDGFEAMKGDWQMCREAAEDAGRCWRAMIDEALKD